MSANAAALVVQALTLFGVAADEVVERRRIDVACSGIDVACSGQIDVEIMMKRRAGDDPADTCHAPVVNAERVDPESAGDRGIKHDWPGIA